MERKLATIEKIIDLNPISGADRIEVATVRNWKTVVKKGEFKVGDKCVFFEIDSFLPDDERYSFLGSTINFEGNIGYRLRTIKLRGQISQGLALPLNKFPEIFQRDYVGEDVTEVLGVIKYEKTIIDETGETKGNFPFFIKKSGLKRIQNLRLKTLLNQEFEVSEKLDGTSFTAYYWEGVKGVCSRNLEKKLEEDSIYTHVYEKYGLDNFFDTIGEGYALQGEIISPKIQKNIYKRTSPELYIYDLYDIKNSTYLLPKERYELLIYSSLINCVPDLGHLTLTDNITVEDLLEYADGKSYLERSVNREGLVFKSLTDPTVRFKIISNKFLLKNED